MRSHIFVICLSILFLFAGNASSELDSPPWSEKFFQYVEQEYGAKAAERLHYLQDFILQNKDLPVMEKLQLVNKTMNRLPWIADKEHWQKVDYWATPMETITTFGGDWRMSLS